MRALTGLSVCVKSGCDWGECMSHSTLLASCKRAMAVLGYLFAVKNAARGGPQSSN